MYTVFETPIVGSFFRAFANVVLWLWGWKKEGSLPDIRRAVIISAHHTSNWDGLMLMLYGLAFGIKIKVGWLGKRNLFKFPYAGILKWLGGIPIDRGKKENTVNQVAEIFKRYENLFLIVLPEGTRGRTDYWTSGFYYIAKEAGVPILCIYGDYRIRAAGFGPILDPSRMSIDEVFISLQETYGNKTAKYPERVGPIRRKTDDTGQH
jgi:1-acyl-sn-glycerol-3-phosphate acyltransferase